MYFSLKGSTAKYEENVSSECERMRFTGGEKLENCYAHLSGNFTGYFIGILTDKCGKIG